MSKVSRLRLHNPVGLQRFQDGRWLGSYLDLILRRSPHPSVPWSPIHYGEKMTSRPPEDVWLKVCKPRRKKQRPHTRASQRFGDGVDPARLPRKEVLGPAYKHEIGGHEDPTDRQSSRIIVTVSIIFIFTSIVCSVDVGQWKGGEACTCHDPGVPRCWKETQAWQ